MLKYLMLKSIIFLEVSFLFLKSVIIIVETITLFELEIFAVCIFEVKKLIWTPLTESHFKHLKLPLYYLYNECIVIS